MPEELKPLTQLVFFPRGYHLGFATEVGVTGFYSMEEGHSGLLVVPKDSKMNGMSLCFLSDNDRDILAKHWGLSPDDAFCSAKDVESSDFLNSNSESPGDEVEEMIAIDVLCKNPNAKKID